MKILYTDASFDHRHTSATKEYIVRGKIAVSDGTQFNRVEKIVVGKVNGLQQYINIFELIAVARAIELACDMTMKERSLHIFTDSQTAMYWARNGIRNKDVITPAHISVLEYLKDSKIKFGGSILFDFISRDLNHAGFLLAEELEREAPHAQ